MSLTSPTTHPSSWRQAVQAVLDDPQQLRLVFQPVADLETGTVVGYEALARFAGPPQASPGRWFRAAAHEGLAAQLEARVLRAALAARAALPEGSFLTMNVGPNVLAQPELEAAFGTQANLSNVVIELTEHTSVESYRAMEGVLTKLRSAGAAVAVDDAGAGYGSLQHVLTLRPEFVKLDRSLVGGIDDDEAKAALVEMLGTLARRLGARLVAEGIERPEELETLVRLGVPLGQGFLLGRPSPELAVLSDETRGQIRRHAAARAANGVVASVVEQVPTVVESRWQAAAELLLAEDGLDVMAVVDDEGHPVGLLTPTGTDADQLQPVTTLSTAERPLGEVVAEAMARPLANRFDPLLACDATGRLIGLVRLERLVAKLC